MHILWRAPGRPTHCRSRNPVATARWDAPVQQCVRNRQREGTKLALGKLVDPEISRDILYTPCALGLRPGAVAALNTGAETIVIHSERKPPRYP